MKTVRSVFFKAICRNSSTSLSENQAEDRKFFLNKTFPLARFDSVEMVQPYFTVFDCLLDNFEAEVMLLLLDRLDTSEAWAEKAKQVLINDQRGVSEFFLNRLHISFK